MPVLFEPKFVDLVRTSSTTIGTGALVPGAAGAGFASFAQVLLPGDRFYYCVQGIEKPLQREVGRGTLQADGTITREPVSGALTNFTAGNKTIALVTAAEWFRKVEAQGGVSSVAVSGLASVVSRAELAARPATSGSQVALTEPGRSGGFVFNPAALANRVAADPAQGVYVAPLSDPSGASGAWVRQFTGAMDVRWFGAKADLFTNALPAFIAAHNLIKSGFAGSRRLLAEGAFYLSGTFHMTTTMILEGSGPGFDSTLRSIMRFAKNAHGIVVHHAQSSLLVGLSGDASGSRIAHLQLWGGNANVDGAGNVTSFAAGDSPSGHGLRLRGAFVTVEDVQTSFFGGDGFNIVATSGAGGEAGGNANNCRLDNCQSIYNRGNGYTFSGTDANACATYMCSAISCGGGGIVDYSFLGNAHRDAHVRDCGIADPTGGNGPTGCCTYGGVFYYVVNGRQGQASLEVPGSVTNGIEAWRPYNGYGGKAWVAGLTWINGAPYSTNPGNLNCANCIFDNCYAESGQPANQIYAPAMLVGGLLYENGHDPDATAGWLRSGGAHAFTMGGAKAIRANGTFQAFEIEAAARAVPFLSEPGSQTLGLHIFGGGDNQGQGVTFGSRNDGKGGRAGLGGMIHYLEAGVGGNLLLGTTDSFQLGFKTAIRIDPSGNVDINRAELRVAGVPIKSATPINNQAGSYVAVRGDAGGYVRLLAAAGVTFGIPANATVPFPIGTVIEIEQAGAGTVTLEAAAGVTINSRAADLSLAGQYAVAAIKKVAVNTWTLTGDL